MKKVYDEEFNYVSFGANNKVKVEITEYANGQNAILLTSYDSQFNYYEPFLTASIALDVHPGGNKVYIKNYSENVGILDFLIKNNIVSEPLFTVQSGYVEIPVCEIL